LSLGVKFFRFFFFSWDPDPTPARCQVLGSDAMSAPTRRRDWVAPIAVAVLAAAAAFVALDRNSGTAPSRVLFSNCTVNTGEVSFYSQ